MTADPDCLFCGIVAGRVPVQVVYTSDGAIGFRDLNPQAPTHVLVIPREHHADVSALVAAGPDAVAAVLGAATEVARQEGLTDGFRLVFNSGRDAGQSVLHVHVHVLGGRAIGWPPG